MIYSKEREKPSLDLTNILSFYAAFLECGEWRTAKLVIFFVQSIQWKSSIKIGKKYVGEIKF